MDRSVRRRSPKNVATVPGLFDGPGGLSESETSLETFLANDVERPAATALRRMLQSASIEQLPPEVMRYLSWAASRSLPMQRLEAEWATRYRPTLNGPMATNGWITDKPEGVAHHVVRKHLCRDGQRRGRRLVRRNVVPRPRDPRRSLRMTCTIVVGARSE